MSCIGYGLVEVATEGLWGRRARRADEAVGRDVCGRADSARQPAAGKSRDMRGIRTSYKITPEASSPVITGSLAFATWRSVKPSAQPTLVRTHTRHQAFPYISANSASQDCPLLGKAAVLRTVVFTSVRTSDSEVRRKYPGQNRPKGQVVRGGHRPIGARSGIRGIYAGWIMCLYGVVHAPVVDHLCALKRPLLDAEPARPARRSAPIVRSGGVSPQGLFRASITTAAISAAAG
jgi:hypothetical protein